MFTAKSHRDLGEIYDQLAPDYDRLHRRWLKRAGGEAQAALEATVRALATPITNVLDVGCGTGAFARALIAEGMSPLQMTLLDPSDAMLARCADIPVRQVKGRLEALPFEDSEFDIVTCAWALETVPHPEVALRELCRAVRRGGVLCLAFCAETPARNMTDWLSCQAIIWRGTGCFLSREQVIEYLRASGEFEVRVLPSHGPAAALLARRLSKLGATRPEIPDTLSSGSETSK